MKVRDELKEVNDGKADSMDDQKVFEGVSFEQKPGERKKEKGEKR